MDVRVRYLVALAELERAAKSLALAGLAAAELATSMDESSESNAAAIETVERCRAALAAAALRAPGLRHLFP
jgi:hypothetical protein